MTFSWENTDITIKIRSISQALTTEAKSAEDPNTGTARRCEEVDLSSASMSMPLYLNPSCP
jgi:hypothetical protein